MQPDPQAGARLLEGVDHPVLETARRMLFGLEERWDGAGHPSGARGEAIPLEARIVAAARAWDEGERRGLSVEERIAEAEASAGRRFDPRVVEALVEAHRVGA
ncbi:MAG: HD domain-containing phosphohydrolase [Gemmatimonadota bacterium]|nr:HD domain-containing phosphohydrolase [Gemmatimonadota bacterium]